MRFGFTPIRGSNPRASAPEQGVCATVQAPCFVSVIICALRRHMAHSARVDSARVAHGAISVDFAWCPQVEELLTREYVYLRDRALWRMLYETAARAGEILALDVADLAMPNRCAGGGARAARSTWWCGRPAPRGGSADRKINREDRALPRARPFRTFEKVMAKRQSARLKLRTARSRYISGIVWLDSISGQRQGTSDLRHSPFRRSHLRPRSHVCWQMPTFMRHYASRIPFI